MPWAPGGAQGIGPQEAEGRLSRPTAIPTAIPTWPGPCPGLARPCAWPGPCPALAGGGDGGRGGGAGAGGVGDPALGGGRGVPWPGSVIPDFTLPDTLEKNFVRDLASNFSK